MKKTRLLLFALIAVLILAACGGDEAAEPAATNPPQATQPAGPTATLPPPPVVVEEGSGDDSQQPTAEPTALPPWPADKFGYGVQSHALVGDPNYTMDVISNQLGMDWVKVQLEWPLMEAQEDIYDGVVAEANEHGLHLLFSIVGAPDATRAAGNENGPPDDYALFANFLTRLIQRYPGQIHAIEVWNEQNLDREWSTANGISPEDYVSFLSQAYAAIKAADPDIIVISGALAPTGSGDWVRWADDFEYMDRALAAGMLQYADCVGAHHNGYNIPPDMAFDQTGSFPEAGTATFRGPFDDPHHSWSFKTTLDTYAEKVQAIDPNMKLCVTEFGWASSEGYDTYPDTFEFALDNTLEEQAQFIVQAFQQMNSSGDVWLAFLFNFDFGNKVGNPADDPVPYSIIDLQGAPRPAFGAVAAMEKE